MARAIAILYFWPPEICEPFAPTYLLNPEVNPMRLFLSMSIAIC
jgi:hypothetical protein